VIVGRALRGLVVVATLAFALALGTSHAAALEFRAVAENAASNDASGNVMSSNLPTWNVTPSGERSRRRATAIILAQGWTALDELPGTAAELEDTRPVSEAA